MTLKEGGIRGSLRNVGVEVVAIPDTSMFQNPLYQFYAGSISGSDGDSPVPYPEVLAGLSDATAVDSPVYRVDKSDGAGNEYDAVEYDGVNDGHNWTPDANLPTGSESFSWAVLAWFENTDQTMTFAGYGADDTEQFNGFTRRNDSGNNVLQHFFFGNDLLGNTTIPSGEWVTLGMRYDGTNRKLYLNGSGDGSDSPGSVNVQDQNHSIGYWNRASTSNANFTDGFIGEVILSDTAESDQAFADYHNNRLG